MRAIITLCMSFEDGEILEAEVPTGGGTGTAPSVDARVDGAHGDASDGLVAHAKDTASLSAALAGLHSVLAMTQDLWTPETHRMVSVTREDASPPKRC